MVAMRVITQLRAHALASPVAPLLAATLLAGCLFDPAECTRERLASGSCAGDVSYAPPTGPWFEDVTVPAGLAFERAPVEGYVTMVDRVSGGVCVLDVDGRPPLDLFFAVRPATDSGSRLFVARGVRDYVEETASRGLSDTGDAVGCLAFDAEGDGDDDLLVTGLSTLHLFLNDGGVFADHTVLLDASPASGAVYASAAAGDIDGDRDLDLLVAGFLDIAALRTDRDCGGLPCEMRLDSYRGVENLLLRRESDGRYTEVSSELAPELALREPTLMVAISDIDADGRPDLYVGNDGGSVFRDRVLVADAAGIFRDASDRVGLAYDARGHGIDTMGWSTGDVNGDGRMDYAVTAFQGHASPVFVCGQDGYCDDRGPAVGTRALASTFRWGNALADIDLDGDVDLFEAAGHVFTEAEAAGIGLSIRHAQPPNLSVNSGDGELLRVQAEAGDALAQPHCGRGLATADLDDDGRPDVIIATTQGPPAVLRNVHSPAGGFVRVVLRGRSPNSAGVGARVEVTDGSRTLVRERTVGEGFLGSFDPRLHFGIGGADSVDVKVTWPGGAISIVERIAVGEEIVVDEP